jgi:phospholipase/carboxylesterase
MPVLKALEESMSMSWAMQREKIGKLNCVSIVPQREQAIKRIAFFCHGFGAPGDDLVALAEPMLQTLLEDDSPIALYFPAAPIDLAEYNMPGGRAWWPLNMARLMQLAAINDFGEMRDEAPPEIDYARECLVDCIETVLDRLHLSCSDMTLGGFSQGAMLSVDTVIRGLKDPPRKLVVMSGALICESLWRGGADKLLNLPVVQSHGTMDSILPIQTGRWLREFLLDSHAKVDYTEFAGDHTIPYEIIPKLVS